MTNVRRGQRDNFFIRYPKEHPILTWLITALFGFIMFLIGFMFPDGIENLNHYGFHLGGLQFTTFQFHQMELFKKEFNKVEVSKQILVVSNDYKTKLFPRLEIETNSSIDGIIIECKEQISGNECNKGFPIPANDLVVLELDINITSPKADSYKWRFKIVDGRNFRTKDIEVLIKS